MRRLVTALLSFTLIVVLARPASAHNGSTKFVHASLSGDDVELVVDIDVIDASMELELDPDEEDSFVGGAGRDRFGEWLVRALTVSSGGERCPSRVGAVELITRNHVRYVRAKVRATCPDAGPMVLHDDAIFPVDAQHEAFVELPSGRVVVLRQGRQEVTLALPREGRGALLLTFVVEGFRHLVLGYDHLLFLLTLLLVSGERVQREGFRKTLGSVAVIVTAFTLGHSATLIAAALDVVVLPVRWVEAAIALSIFLVALMNVTRPEAHRARTGVAAVFGLVHGFGFSNVLRQLSLPTEGRVLGLLAFNVGIEIGQLAFVILIIGPLAWAARRAWYRSRVVVFGSALIAVVAMYWFVQRLAG